MSQEQKMENKSTPTLFIHSLLAKSYSVFSWVYRWCLARCRIPVSIMQNGAPLVGVFIMLLGTALIFGLKNFQENSSCQKNNPEHTARCFYFYKGPGIRYSQSHACRACIVSWFNYGFWRTLLSS